MQQTAMQVSATRGLTATAFIKMSQEPLGHAKSQFQPRCCQPDVEASWPPVGHTKSGANRRNHGLSFEVACQEVSRLLTTNNLRPPRNEPRVGVCPEETPPHPISKRAAPSLSCSFYSWHLFDTLTSFRALV